MVNFTQSTTPWIALFVACKSKSKIHCASNSVSDQMVHFLLEIGRRYTIPGSWNCRNAATIYYWWIGGNVMLDWPSFRRCLNMKQAVRSQARRFPYGVFRTSSDWFSRIGFGRGRLLPLKSIYSLRILSAAPKACL